jgi:protein-S-isoprenylcysteine O-methyltransferase Ste14
VLVLRAIVAVLLLPGTMGVVLPLFVIDPDRPQGVVNIAGLLLVAAGALLLGWSVREFLIVGKGTLAPWWPPKQLVTSGPFRFSRNPLYIAMGAIAAGWAVAYWSRPLALYAIVLLLMFQLRILLGEEPTMARHFGPQWEAYARRVPRWVGRINAETT